MTLSVIIPTYNRAGGLLQESLVSILEQTRPPDETFAEAFVAIATKNNPRAAFVHPVLRQMVEERID